MTSSASAPIPVAVIGYGSSARTFHIPFLLSLPEVFTLHTIQQRPGSKAGPPADKDHPSVRIAPSFDAVFKGNEGDGADALPPRSLVVITTANETHTPFALQAMKADQNVVIEKPAALTLTEAEALEQEAKARGLVCAAFQNRRLDSDFLTLRALLAPSRTDPSVPSPIGQPTLYESRFDRYRPLSKGGWREEAGPEKGGGMLWDLGAHLIDQALFLFGPPEKVTASAYSARGQLPDHIDDDFLVHLHYPHSAPLPPDSQAPLPGTRIAGPRVTLGASCLSAHIDAEQPRFRVEGTRGSFEKRGTDPQEGQLKARWSPASHPDTFGLYEEHEPASLRFGRLTTATAASESAAGVAANAGSAPVQPKLVASDIPMLPGRYIQFYQNVGQTIRDVAASIATAGEGNDGDSRNTGIQKALDNLFVKPSQTVNNTRCILLARKSAQEGCTLAWDTPLTAETLSQKAGSAAQSLVDNIKGT